MAGFSREDLQMLMREYPAPCLSIYMPAHRGGSEQDPIRWRKHLGEAEEKLVGVGLRAAEARDFVQPARRLLDDPLLWKEQSDGLAYFLADGFERCLRLPMTPPDLVTVSKEFHIKPLLSLSGEDGEFYILALSHNAIRLYRSTRDRGSLIELPNIPANLAEASRTHDSDAFMLFHGHGGAEGGGGAHSVFYSRGGDIDKDKEAMLSFFQRIDRGLQSHIADHRAPLVIATVDYLHALYRKANTYDLLLPEGIEGNPDRWSEQELRERAWKIVRPLFQEPMRQALAQYRQRIGTGMATNELGDVLAAAAEGNVEMLMLAQNRDLWGRYDLPTHFLKLRESPRPGDEELLNFAAIETFRHGGKVYAVPVEEMPENVVVTATLRKSQAMWAGARR
jgi:hypothetical protein